MKVADITDLRSLHPLLILGIPIGFSVIQFTRAKQHTLAKVSNETVIIKTMARRGDVSISKYTDYAKKPKKFTIEENLKAFQPGNDMSSLEFSYVCMRYVCMRPPK